MKESDGMDLIKKRIAASAFAVVTALSVCITAAPVSSVQAQVQDVQSKSGFEVLKKAPLPKDIIALGVGGIRKIWHEKKMRGRGVNEDRAMTLP